MWLPLVVVHRVKAAFWGSGAELHASLPKWCLKGLGGAMDNLWKIYASNAGREETSICFPLFPASHVYNIFPGTRTKADPSPPLWGAWGNLECKESFGPDIGPAALPWCCFIILLEILFLVICKRRRAISRRTLNKCTLCYLEGMISGLWVNMSCFSGWWMVPQCLNLESRAVLAWGFGNFLMKAKRTHIGNWNWDRTKSQTKEQSAWSVGTCIGWKNKKGTN